MPRARTTIDVYEIHTNYGYGWECECAEMSIFAAWECRRDYWNNCPGVRVKIKKTREPKSDYSPDQLQAIEKEIAEARQRWRDRRKADPNVKTTKTA